MLYDEVVAHLGNDFGVFSLTKAGFFFELHVWLFLLVLAGLLQFLKELIAENIETLLIEQHELENLFEEGLVDIFRDGD